MEKLNQSINENLTSLTIQGLVNLYRSKTNLSKLVWLIITIGSICLSVYYSTQTILDYLKFEVTTNVRLINDGQLEFPMITICNKDQFYSTHLNRINFDENAYEIYFNITMSQRSNFTSPIEKILLSCRFSNKKCSHNDFEYIFNKYHGNCYLFNSNITQTSTKLTYKYGLILDFDLSASIDYEPKGFYVGIARKNRNPYRLLSNQLDLSTGIESRIRIDQSHFQRLPYPFSNCRNKFESKFYDKLIQSNYLYTQSLCEDYCRLYYTLLKCNCTIAESSIRIENNKYCQFGTNEFECANEFTKIYSDIVKMCESDEYCPYECDLIRNDITETNIKYNKKKILNKSNIDENDLIRLIFYFRSNDYLNYVEQVSMDFFTLISNLGGVLGLFMGKFILNLI